MSSFEKGKYKTLVKKEIKKRKKILRCKWLIMRNEKANVVTGRDFKRFRSEGEWKAIKYEEIEWSFRVFG